MGSETFSNKQIKQGQCTQGVWELMGQCDSKIERPRELSVNEPEADLCKGHVLLIKLRH